MTCILVVDDELPIVDFLTYNLQREHYDVVAAHDGPTALQQARTHRPDLIVLDLMLPGLDGLEVCRALRRESDVPIIMLTARDAEIDRVVGLELGADDYVVKPFSVRELLARIKAVLRRKQPPDTPPPADHALRAGRLTVDPARHEVRVDETLVDVTPHEFEVLHALARHPGQVLTREQLLETAWGTTYYGDTRAVDSAIKRLRAKLRRAAPDVDIIATVRGIGYKLETGSRPSAVSGQASTS
ncbi:MAG: response regulator transcription factor [Chloroflexi bacterium]|nr:response regulator transcription factor [Chloroflexota bacterium]MBU1746791.1 response regulator transcription factor [Chloroflexota bacterium]